MKASKTLVPDYYAEFHCIGADCEDTCCAAWAVPIGRDTYRRYKQHRHPLLAPLFDQYVHKNKDPATQSEAYYGVMGLTPEGVCGLLGEDKLCAIQKELGAQALSNTCAFYPRQINRFGGQPEQSLNISCPEAARVVLFRPTPMSFVLTDGAPKVSDAHAIMRRFPDGHDGVPEEMAIFGALRQLCLDIVQHRDLALGARLMLLGMVMENADRVVTSASYKDASELVPVIEFGEQVLQHSEMFHGEFVKLAANQAFKLKTLGFILSNTLLEQGNAHFSECLGDAVVCLFGHGEEDGDVLQRYQSAYAQYYRPYFQGREFIWENYLANEIFRQIFPLMNQSPFRLFQELVCNYAIAKLLLVGMAGRHQELTDALVVKLFHSFSRKSSHDRVYLQTLLDLLRERQSDSLLHMMWLLREPDA